MIKATKGYDTSDCSIKTTAVHKLDHGNQRFPISLLSRNPKNIAVHKL